MILGNVQLGYSWFVLGATEGAYLNGCWVKTVDIKANTFSFIRDHIYWFRPDVILTHITFHKAVDQIHGTTKLLQLLSDVRSQLKTRVCYHMGDARTSPRFANNISDSFDLGLVNNFVPDVLENFSRIWGIPCIWWPYACLQQRAIAGVVSHLRCGLAFTGNLGGGELYQARTDFIKALQKKMEIQVFETQGGNDLRYLTPELSASADGILSLPADTDVSGYIDVRPFQYGGAGALLFQRWSDSLNKVFSEDHMVKFEGYDPDIVLDLYDKYSKDREGNIEKRQAVFDYVQLEHSYKRRIHDVLRQFDL